MGNLCVQDQIIKKPEYINEGTIVILRFETEDTLISKAISLHDGNILLTGICMFLESVNLSFRRCKKIIYELDGRELNPKSKISDLNLNYSSNIILSF